MAPPKRLDLLAILSNLFISSTLRTHKKIGAAATFSFFTTYTHTHTHKTTTEDDDAATPVFLNFYLLMLGFG